MSKFKLPTGEGGYDEAAAKPFNDFIDLAGNEIKALRSVVSSFQQQQAQSAVADLRQKAMQSLHSLGHAELFGKPGEAPTAEQAANIEKAIEYIAADEFVEATPKSLRLRKRILTQTDRRKAGRAERKGETAPA